MATNECQSLTMWQFLCRLVPAAMRQTLQIVGVKWLAIVFSGLVCLIGGTSWADPTWLHELKTQPGAILAAAIVMFSVLLLIGAHRLHTEDHAKWGDTLQGVHSEFAALKASVVSASPSPAPASLDHIHKIIKNFMLHGSYLISGDERDKCTAWIAAVAEFTSLVFEPPFRHEFDLLHHNVANKARPEVALVGLQSEWFRINLRRIEQSDIAEGATEKQLFKWDRWPN